MKRSIPITVGYLLNPDPIFYNELDFYFINALQNNGLKVIQLQLKEISIKASKEGIQIFNAKEKLQKLDGFLSYGYMSNLNMQKYLYLVKSLEQMGVYCLYGSEAIRILTDKCLQSLMFAQAGLHVPDTYFAADIESIRHAYSNLPGKSIIKSLNDYGGDGVILMNHPDQGVDVSVKRLWNSQLSIQQKYISGCEGQSIRVLIVNNKPIACITYIDKAGDFRSNSNFHENFTTSNLINHQKFDKYCEVALAALKSAKIQILHAGVDLIDDMENIHVLEMNIWPDMLDIGATTNLDTVDLLTKAFKEKVLLNIPQIKADPQ
ncbi:ribosomal protein s6 modification protein [Stylonychia lemnae]|uniref:Ribosomal protein s6 modification protein n=1 Tax=Stylonychia lemnae TaxID=5949 RepID=A0A078A2Z7_STYLE|nr:ribosomal protein s6 modification protein [Stylonychia lemnae]|eukprot:CDW76202.1 ribosomal protein s6 modification protein [Stylonychia lemnae]